MNTLMLLSPVSAWLVMLALSARAAGETRLPLTQLLSLRHLFWGYALPTLFILLLQQLGRRMDLHLYALNPCEAYWFDVVDPRRLARLAAVLGRDFQDNAIEIDQLRDGVRLTGFAGLPTYNRGNAAHQYLFVNGRPVRDRLLQGALRGAYADFLARDRHPAAALYLELDPTYVDVNVHPAKAEVRFRDPGLVRGLIIGALRQTLSGALHRASTTGGARTLETLARVISDPRDGGEKSRLMRLLGDNVAKTC